MEVTLWSDSEVEAVLNSRPVTYLYPDIEDNPPLTLVHFLCGYRLTTLPNLVQDKEVHSSICASPMIRKARTFKQN